IPFASVADVAGVMKPPPVPTAQRTGTPDTGSPIAFFTATEYVASVLPTIADWRSPASSAIVLAVVVIPLALNVTELPVSPGTAASSVFSPGSAASVQVPARATPRESVRQPPRTRP